ncbi:MAG: hypothetical protein JW751_15985 [Polyangiaceae bacterium]|nr:hypothetical protein [Polyangiaceae bacterium]
MVRRFAFAISALLGAVLFLVRCGGAAEQDDGPLGGPAANGAGSPGGEGAEEAAGAHAGGMAGTAGAAWTQAGAGAAAGAGGDGATGGNEATGGSEMPSGGAVAGAGGDGVRAGAGGAGRDDLDGYCLGFAPEPSTLARVRCATHADCSPVTGAPIHLCALEPFTFECGGPAPVRTCEVDADCTADAICVEDPCGSTFCVLGCPASPCPDTEDCIEKHCVARPCDGEGASPCPERHSCLPLDPGADARGCVPDPCGADAPCQEGWDCRSGVAADAHGCVHRACSVATDCDCGSCVNGYCEATPGFCFDYAPPP